ncbi:hypothetical protein FOA52_013210 [Chlamydomonas sp. UWO 241]|nr:hypothetical protein FOA52_013210 [Chlamydomonas sp. UWO 241]
MDGEIEIKGLSLGGVVTQGLSQADLFQFRTTRQMQNQGQGSGDVTTHIEVTAVLKPLDIPVRAMILPLLQESANTYMKSVVDAVLLPALPPGAVWLQDHRLYHATIYHASSHSMPVPATPDEVADEARAIRSVTSRHCPIHGVLERVVITNTGVIVACWQVLPTGTEPADLRASLAEALPNSPPKEGQMVKEASMLHTTVARLLQPPESLDEVVDVALVAQAVRDLSRQLCGLTAVFDEVWFVEEQDLLALALEGRYIKHAAPLSCPGQALS